jgi:broad specificity phosphatase PhoE
MVLPEVRAWYPEEYATMLADLEGYRIEGGGESRNDVKTRVNAAMKDILAKGEAMKGNVSFGIVSHTTAIRAILAKLTPDYDVKAENFGNTSVTTLTKASDGTWKLTAINDQTHLEGLESRFMPEVEYDK